MSQLREMLSETELEELGSWMRGQTMSVCEGRHYSHETKDYYESCGGVAHGVVVYRGDVARFMSGLPVID